MKTATLFTILQVYFWLGAVLMIVFVGRLVVMGFREVDIPEFQKAIFSGKKPKTDAEVQSKLDRGGKLYRKVMFVWMIGFLLLAIGGSILTK